MWVLQWFWNTLAKTITFVMVSSTQSQHAMCVDIVVMCGQGVCMWPACVCVCLCGQGVCVCGQGVCVVKVLLWVWQRWSDQSVCMWQTCVCVCVCYRVPKVCAGVAKVVVGVAMACVWPRCCFVCGQCMWRPSAPPAAATSLPEMHVVVCYPDALFNCCAISVPSSA